MNTNNCNCISYGLMLFNRAGTVDRNEMTEQMIKRPQKAKNIRPNSTVLKVVCRPIVQRSIECHRTESVFELFPTLDRLGTIGLTI